MFITAKIRGSALRQLSPGAPGGVAAARRHVGGRSYPCRSFYGVGTLNGGTGRRAQVLAEFAICLPLLLTLLFFLLETGFYLYAKNGIQVALREGAVLSAVLSRDGRLSPANRSAVAEAMRVALARPGLSGRWVTVKTARHGGGETLTLGVAAYYSGLTPLKRFFDKSPIQGRLVLSLGSARPAPERGLR